MSKVVDYRANTLATVSQAGESMLAHAVIHVDALREQRRRVGMANLLARQPCDIYTQVYAAAERRVGDGLIKDGEVQPPADRDWFRQRQEQQLERLTKLGII